MENDSINFSLNMSQIDLDQSNKTVAIPHVLQLPTVYDFLPSTSTESTTQSSIQRRSTTPLPTQQDFALPTTSTASQFKPPKRPRSPLPSFELSGPTATPSTGGFTGEGVESIQKDSKQFSNILWRKC
ncbi:uncharacterized protein LOC128869189 [Anastrepha ludens]|uniref:uncharacterized protein LOC128869155 n=1 Tax=Anastrepha ludens TaxID=28586 RepID=UPI0023B17DFE|nr:uncharacterized protein LOC128869155 [Anastrepha ludens]XP_053967675.1 uncharacterized protein LOC128869189 [Anastrepha ludens]